MIRATDPVGATAPAMQAAPTREARTEVPVGEHDGGAAALQSTSTISLDAAVSNVADRKADLKEAIAGAGEEAKGAEGPAQGDAPTNDKDSARESYRDLIGKDIKAAYGRDATDQDYDYWLGKLEGPNDSGFVTSGKMSATEYWHRRMLGWQAGGDDVASSGPYAGGGGPHGDVTPATDLVPGVPPGGVYNQASPERIAELQHVISSDIQSAYGREATDEDYGYWLNKFVGENDSGYVTSGRMTSDEYWHRRLLGWQAGGDDVALFGPYAGGGNETGPAVPPVGSLIEAFRAGHG